MSQNLIQPSFASGELSPSLFARVDLAKYRTGLSECYNWFVDYRGGISTRPGTIFVDFCQSLGTIRLIPFQFNTTQTYMLEFGNTYMRVIKDGGHVLEPTKAVTGFATAPDVRLTVVAHGFSNAEWVYVTGLIGPARINDRVYSVLVVNANTITLLDQQGNALNPVRYPGAWTSGGTVARVYTISTPYTTDELSTLKYTQSADTMTLTHRNHPPADLTRTGHAAWTLAPITFAATTSPPTSVVAIPSSAGTVGYYYVVTSVGADNSESVRSEPGASLSSVNMSSTAGSIRVVWAAPAGGAQRYNIYRAQAAVGNTLSSTVPFGYIGTSYSSSFVDSNVIPDFAIQPPTHTNPFAPSQIISVFITSGGAAVPFGTTIAVTDASGTGARLTPVVDANTATIQNVAILDGGRDYVAPVLTPSAGGAVISGILGPSTGTYPGVVTYFQQRRVFANSLNSPQGFWMSQPGLYANFDTSLPVKDDDAISGILASSQVNDIKWLVNMPSGLIALTGGSAWQISGATQGGAVSPRTITAAPQSYGGVADIKPIVINSDILYVQSLGSIVRDLVYNFFANVYVGTDITVLSNHLFFNHTIVSWAYAEEPYKIIWAARDDGTFLSLTFLKEQEVSGWAQHETDGNVIEISSVIENDETAVYMVVERGGLNMIERLASRKFTSLTAAWCVDAGISYSGAPATFITGLDHLEGQTVAILADGVVKPQQMVTAGAITLTAAASAVIVGLPYQCRAASLALDTGDPTVQGKRKKISAVTFRVDNSRGLKAGLSYSDVKPLKEAGAATELQSTDERIVLQPNWDQFGRVYWVQDNPLPSTVLGIIPEVTGGDTDR